jgi:hypothetical protein
VHSSHFVCDLKGFEETADSLISNLLEMGMKLCVSLEKDDFQELLEYHTQEFSNKDIIELGSQRVGNGITEDWQEAYNSSSWSKVSA